MLSEKEILFNMAYKEIFASLYSRAFKYCNDKQLAQDATHNTFVKAWENFEQLKDKAKFKGWLFVILINDLHSKYKKNVNIKHIDYSTALENDSLSQDLFKRIKDSPIDRSDLRMDLKHILNSAGLSPQQMKIYNLRYIQDLKIDEIAIRLNISVGSVKKQLNRIANQFNDIKY